MSCIPRLLELKGDKKILRLSRATVLEGGGNYKGFDYCVTFTRFGFRCGYVAVPAANDFAKSEELADTLNVHGGVSHHAAPDEFSPLRKLIKGDSCGDVWIGFDTNRSGDAYDLKLAKKYFPRTFATSLAYVNEMFADEGWENKSFKFVEDQCKGIIEQIIRRSNVKPRKMKCAA